VSFTVGALLPLLAILVVSQPLRVPVTVAAVLVALALTGAVGARFGGTTTAPATARVILGGALAMATTYLIGHVVGIAV
jgi:VIT1/CCC1 family predicted Fe2+/Mn2+ transporter